MRLSAPGLFAAAAALALCGCARDTAPGLLAAARAQLQAGHAQAAVVELKSSLQLDPAQPEARWLLGLTLLDQALAAQALIELEKAAALGLPESQVAPPTARAMLALGQTRQVVDRYSRTQLAAGDAAAELQTSVATAYAAQGLRGPAAATLQQVLLQSPQHAPAVLLQVRLLAAGGELQAAQDRLGELLAKDPQNANGWQLRADLLARQGAAAGAEAQAAYRRALALRPNQVPAHAGLIAALLRAGDVSAARQQLEAMRQAQPADPLTDFAGAQVALAEGQLTPARELGQSALRALPENAQILQFVGLTELQQGSALAAEAPLLRSLQRAPDATLTRQLLARVYLATGQPGKLEAVLEPLLQRADPQALRLLAQARLQAGQPVAAQALLLRAPAAEPDRPDTPGDLEADRLRVEGLIASRQFDAAAAAIDGLEASRPQQAGTAQLRGRLGLAQRDPGAARAAFERALALAPADTPSVLALAALDAQAGQPALAQTRLQALLQAQPDEAAASLALATLLERGEPRSERAHTLLADALRVHPGDVPLRLAYARHLQRQGQGPAAEVVLQDGAKAMGGNAELLEALAGLQLRQREYGQALLTLNKLLPLRPGAIEPWLRIAEAQVGLGANAPARLALERALVLRPGSLQAQRGLISLALLERQPQAALARARQVQQQRGALGVGLALEGDVLAAGGNMAGAATVYLDGLRRSPGTELAAKAHAALLAQGQARAAAAMAADWRRSHPRDADFAVHLGNGALARGDAATAEREFQDAVRLQPLHGLALNNLATAMLQLGHAGALPYARRAAALLPDSPEVRDTLAAAERAERPPALAVAPTPAAAR